MLKAVVCALYVIYYYKKKISLELIDSQLISKLYQSTANFKLIDNKFRFCKKRISKKLKTFKSTCLLRVKEL